MSNFLTSTDDLQGDDWSGTVLCHGLSGVISRFEIWLFTGQILSL